MMKAAIDDLEQAKKSLLERPRWPYKARNGTEQERRLREQALLKVILDVYDWLTSPTSSFPAVCAGLDLDLEAVRQGLRERYNIDDVRRIALERLKEHVQNGWVPR